MDLARSSEVAAEWVAMGKSVAVATLIRARGPAPRPLGSRFLISSSGDMDGSVSGGCVENDVFLHAQQILNGGEAKLVGYGISDETAFEVGLSCGGEIDVFIEPWIDELARFSMSGGIGAVATVVAGPAYGAKGIFDHEQSWVFSTLPEDLAGELEPSVRTVIETERPSVVVVGNSQAFIEAVAPAPRLVIFGAVEIGQVLCALAARIGFSVTVCDPRAAFATPDRFPEASRVITAWPEDALDELALDGRTFVVILSHDPLYEDPVVKDALQRSVRYLGAMGSRKTHAKRVARLKGEGLSATALDRIHGPIGLGLGAESAGETAVEILAEITQVRHEPGT